MPNPVHSWILCSEYSPIHFCPIQEVLIKSSTHLDLSVQFERISISIFHIIQLYQDKKISANTYILQYKVQLWKKLIERICKRKKWISEEEYITSNTTEELLSLIKIKHWNIMDILWKKEGNFLFTWLNNLRDSEYFCSRPLIISITLFWTKPSIVNWQQQYHKNTTCYTKCLNIEYWLTCSGQCVQLAALELGISNLLGGFNSPL